MSYIGDVLNTTGLGTPANRYAAGSQAGGGYNPQDAVEFANRNNLNLNAEQILRLQSALNEQQANAELARQQQGAAFGSGLSNANRTQDTQRTMVINAQQNAAQNVANQLNALQSARATNANAITNAINAGNLR